MRYMVKTQDYVLKDELFTKQQNLGLDQTESNSRRQI